MNTPAKNSYAALGRSLPKPRFAVPEVRRRQIPNRYEPPNTTAGITVSTIQAALRAAEGGTTRQLFSLYRDVLLGGGHVQTEFTKRTLGVLGEPYTILPEDKDNADDIAAAAAVKEMINGCENWMGGVAHVMSSFLWPVSVTRKIFVPATPAKGQVNLRFSLKRLEPVNPATFCFQPPTGAAYMPPLDAWEPDLRFYNVSEAGVISWNWAETMAADPEFEIIHRGHLLGGRDNWGGPMRAVLMWWMLGNMLRDSFGRGMERYGAPFIVAKDDTDSPDKLDFLQTALATATKLFGLVVPMDAQIELKEANSQQIAQAHETALHVCNNEISKIIVGQTLSSNAQATGLGSGVANLQGEVLESYRQLDKRMIGGTIRRQLFEQFLTINGLPGRCNIVWGGESPVEIASTADLIAKLSQAQLEPDDEALETISERIGFKLQRRAMPSPGGGFALPSLRGRGTEGEGEQPIPGADDDTMDPDALSARTIPPAPNVSAVIAARHGREFAAAQRARFAPVVRLVEESASPEAAQIAVRDYLAGLGADATARIIEDSLQLNAAAGAVHATK